MPPLGIQDEGGSETKPVFTLNCVGAGITCSTTGTTGTLTVTVASHNFLSATHTDTVAASPTRGDLVVSNSTPAWARFAVGGSNTVLTANGTDPSWSAAPTLTSLTTTGTVTGAILDISSTDIRFSTASLNCSGLGSGGKLTTNGQGVVICAADQTGGGGTAHNILSSTHSDSVAASATRGDLIVANSTPNWARFAVGGSNTVLTANGTDPAWSASPTLTSLTTTGTVSGSILDISTSDVRLNALTASAIVTTNGQRVLVATASPSVTNLTATNTVTGPTTFARTALMVPNSSSPDVVTNGSVGIDSTDNQWLYNDAGTTYAIQPRQTKCIRIENLLASDDAVTFYTFRRPSTVVEANCVTTGFSTQPTITLQTDSNTSMGQNPTCVATASNAPSYTSITSSNTVTGAGVSLQFNTTNTPAPVTGTETVLCVSYTETRE